MSSFTSSAAITIFRAQRPATAEAAQAEVPSDVYDPALDRACELRPALPAIVRADLDARLVAILDARAAYGETVHAAYTRKERELAAIFATLDPIESMVMHRRLVEPNAHDELATRFARLVVDRRNRLLVFLADARRRAARRR